MSAEFVTALLSSPVVGLGALLQSETVSQALSSSLAHQLVAPTDGASRQYLHHLIARLSHFPSTLSFLQLSLYAAAYQPTNAALVSKTVRQALNADPLLFKQCALLGPTSLENTFSTTKPETTPFAQFATAARAHLAFARSTAQLSEVFGQSKAVLDSLARAYDGLLVAYRPDSLSPSNLDYTARQGLDPAAAEWLSLRLEIVETVNTLLEAAFIGPLSDAESPNERTALWDDLERALGPALDSLPPFPRTKGVSLVTQPLLGDLQRYFAVGDQLVSLAGMASGRRAIADAFRKQALKEETEDALELLRDGSGSAAEEIKAINKGKGKAVETTSDNDEILSLGISQILDVLPDLAPSFLKSCLEHPTFEGSPERVLAALFEDDLPPDLRALRDGVPAPSPSSPSQKKETLASARSNVFSDRLDAGQLRRGKAQANADALLADHSFLTDDIKAAIIERAEAESSDEEEDDETEAFAEDFDGGATFKVQDTGDDADDSDEEVNEGTATPTPVAAKDPLANPITPAIAQILELAYLADATIFDRNVAVRRGKPRADLRERTGLADEQLEGWRTMLERNPKKDKLLAKHEFSGNTRGETVQTGSGQGQGNRGRGGGRGGASRGGGERGRGKSDGGRAAHDRRQRGNDRKLSKVA